MSRWIGGNKVHLLENGEAYFPAVFAAIDAARHEVLIETFILFEDKVGQQLQQVLIGAARRGVQIDLLVDGFGSSDLTGPFVGALGAAGVRLRVFDPGRRVFGIRFNLLRRMHRKLVVVDGRVAFVGGINFSADHLADFGPEAKQDYAVAVEGPIVGPIREFALRQIQAPRRVLERFRRPQRPPVAGSADTLFVTRDNQSHRNAIEHHYRVAIRGARQQVVIANAYFFPGWLLLRELRRAARRGVDVRLILQGQPDMPIVKTAASMLYAHLQRDGVRIFEYCKRPLHGKVAVVDDRWATVGSSNLDPLSLSLNLEANLIVRDAAFNRRLSERLNTLMDESCREVEAEPAPRWPLWQQIRSTLVFHVLRGFPVWATRLPAHQPRLEMHTASPGEGD